MRIRNAWPGIMLLILGAGLEVSNAGAETALVTRQSHYAFAVTIQRFEAALRARDMKVFAEIDHAAAAAEVGLKLAPRMVIFYGNPEAGTPLMQDTPTLALDFPQRALVWQDDQGQVWLTLNTAEDLAGYVFPRHGLSLPPEVVRARDALMDGVLDEALK